MSGPQVNGTYCLCIQVPILCWLQDLHHSKMYLWVGEYDRVYNDKTAPFLDAFKQYIEIRTFDYSSEIVGTPFAGDAFFGNGSLVRQHIPALGAFSDVVRILLLHNYGGEWAVRVITTISSPWHGSHVWQSNSKL